ncbi:MAG: prepilin-type N-terminal cleavage/methylation domain-containing protein [Planctomycetes bacterium]|nr:prepilin-type N-terminal cleavage/methylation domain-containing protein [Planctomycetota bacterium]
MGPADSASRRHEHRRGQPVYESRFPRGRIEHHAGALRVQHRPEPGRGPAHRQLPGGHPRSRRAAGGTGADGARDPQTPMNIDEIHGAACVHLAAGLAPRGSMRTQPRGASPAAKWTRGGFTLIELLVVVSIIALLIAILLPSLTKARASAKMLVCLSKQRQVYTASTMWSFDNKQWLVPATFYKKLDKYNLPWPSEIFRCPEVPNWIDPNNQKCIGINQNLCMPTDGPGGAYKGLVVWNWGPGDVFYNTHANARDIDVKHPDRFIYFGDSESAAGGYVLGYWWNALNGRRHDGKADLLWIDGHGTFEPDDYVYTLIPGAAGGGLPYFRTGTP